jgi:hypothetical protein
VIFKSHLLSLLIFATIVSILLAFIKHDDFRPITRYALKIFLYMVVGVIVCSWFMHLV